MSSLLTGLKSLPLDQRASVMAQRMTMLQELGFGAEDILTQDMTDVGLDQTINGLAPFIAGQKPAVSAGQREFESLIKDFSPEDQVKARRTKAGLDARAVTKADTIVTMPDGSKRIFDEGAKTFSGPIEVDAEGNETVSTAEVQLDDKVGAAITETTEVGAAVTDVEVERQKKLNEVAIDKELRLTDMKDLKVRRKAFISQGAAAKDSITNIGRMQEINNRIITGGATAITKAMTDFLGMTSADLGEFNRRSGELVLSTIRQLGANPTEGERSFLERIQPAVGQSAEVNSAILSDLMTISQRQVERSRKVAADPSVDPNVLILNEPDFVPSFNGGQSQQAPQQVQQQTTLPVDTSGNLDTDAYIDNLF